MFLVRGFSPVPGIRPHRCGDRREHGPCSLGHFGRQSPVKHTHAGRDGAPEGNRRGTTRDGSPHSQDECDMHQHRRESSFPQQDFCTTQSSWKLETPPNSKPALPSNRRTFGSAERFRRSCGNRCAPHTWCSRHLDEPVQRLPGRGNAARPMCGGERRMVGLRRQELPSGRNLQRDKSGLGVSARLGFRRNNSSAPNSPIDRIPRVRGKDLVFELILYRFQILVCCRRCGAGRGTEIEGRGRMRGRRERDWLTGAAAVTWGRVCGVSCRPAEGSIRQLPDWMVSREAHLFKERRAFRPAPGRMMPRVLREHPRTLFPDTSRRASRTVACDRAPCDAVEVFREVGAWSGSTKTPCA